MTTDTLPQFAPFDSFVCEGDARIVQVGPFVIRAKIEHDSDTKPTEFDGYTEEQIAAWLRDDWHFVGVVLCVYVNNIKLVDYAASLWGTDCNLGDNTHITAIANELLPEALEAAQEVRVKLLAKLA
jgi:hypothetical protein